MNNSGPGSLRKGDSAAMEAGNFESRKSLRLAQMRAETGRNISKRAGRTRKRIKRSFGR